MRIRILDRILVAVAGIILIAVCGGVVAQVFFSVDVLGAISRALTAENTTRKILIGAVAVILLVLGMYCLLMLFRHRKRKDKFVVQKLESGDLAISLKTVETMVEKCLKQHNEIQTESIKLENQRDGLLIRIRGTVAGGISIPLTVDTVQKQVKQYVTAGSGVEVKGIRIQIEASGEDAVNAPFAIDPPVNNLLPKGGETPEEEGASVPAGEDVQETPAETEPAAPAEGEKPAQTEETAAAAAFAAAESLMNDLDTEDDRPIHQRLFSMQEEPCIMPLPPENIGENSSASEETEKTEPAEEKTEPAEEKTEPAEEKTEPAEDVKAEDVKKEESTESAVMPEESAADEMKGEDNA